MKRAGAYIILVVVLVSCFTGFGTAVYATGTDIGMWYSTWYSKLPEINSVWISNFGASSLSQFIGDVNGDGKDDAVTFENGGVWNVAISNGNGFNAPTQWGNGLGSGSNRQFLADVNGDGKMDAVTFTSSAGTWNAAISNGSGFNTPTQWAVGLGTGSGNQFLADINGDGKKDAVAYLSATGTWNAGLSSGSGFGSSTPWCTGHGVGSSNQLMGDLNSDGKEDAIVYFSSGAWYAANSNGNGFDSYYSLCSGHGYGSNIQRVYDGNGDGYADLYVYFNGDVNGDGKPGDLYGREYERSTQALGGNTVFNSGFGSNATRFMQGNVIGDVYNWKSNVAFYAGTNGGTWKVERYRATDTVVTNTWLGFGGKPEIKYKPLTLGVYQQYDSGNINVVNEHLATIADAKIDWLLLDETNGLNAESGAILNRAKVLAQCVKIWNDNSANRDIKYAFAIGGIQWTNHPLTIEQEARQVWDEFADNPAFGGSNYHYYLDGKPLLVVYTSVENQTAWKNYTGDKSATNHFTVRFASSCLPGEYGWPLPQTGTVDNDDVMVVMPGWNNHVGNLPPVLRNNGSYYSTSCWDKVIKRAVKPQTVIINSFNEFAEDTGVQIADTSALTTSEMWTNSCGVIDNDLYWNMTKDFINQLKGLANMAHIGYSSTQGGDNWNYEQWDWSSGTRVITPMTWDSSNSRWKGAAPYCLVGSNWQHPDLNCESVRKFTLPKSGNIKITGNAALQSLSGDGIKIKIKKNDQDFWPVGGGYTTITTRTGVDINIQTTVNANDIFQFIVNCNGTISYDTTIWNAVITYQ